LKNGPSSDGIDGIANQILGYIAEHPDAQDTIEGVTRWWLLHQTIQYRILEVQNALAGLVAGGWLVREETGETHVYYRANRAKLPQLRPAGRIESLGCGADPDAVHPQNNGDNGSKYGQR
jgi:hypothetical protein